MVYWLDNLSGLVLDRKKIYLLPVIQSVFEAMSYSDAYLITNYLWNLIAIVILFSLYGTGDFKRYKTDKTV